MCSVNLWQEAQEALARDFSHSGSLGTLRRGHVGSIAGRPDTRIRIRFQIGRQFKARESQWSRLSIGNFRMSESVLVEKLWGIE